MKNYSTSRSYVSPQTRTIAFKLTQILCQSPMTEKFTVGSDSYDEDDFTE